MSAADERSTERPMKTTDAVLPTNGADIDAPATTRRRPWWRRFVQLRLATLLLFVTLIAGAFGFRQRFLVPYERQAAAVEKLMASGAEVLYESAEPQWVAPLVGDEKFRNVAWVKIEHRRVSDEQLDALLDLPFVRNLYLAGNPITDEGIRNLLPVTSVRRMSLWRTDITDVGVEYLSRNRELEALDLHSTRVTDEGLIHLKKLPNLQELKLGPRVSNAGLAHIAGLSKLRILDVSQTRITLDGLALLRDCPIEEIVLPPSLRRVRGDELRHIAPLTRLRTMPFDLVEYCDDEDLDLLPLERIESIMVSGPRLTGVGIRKLLAAPNMREITASGKFTADDFQRLPKSRPIQVTLISPLIKPNEEKEVRRTPRGEVLFALKSAWHVDRFNRANSGRRFPLIRNQGAVKFLASDRAPCYPDFAPEAYVSDWSPLPELGAVSNLGIALADDESLPIHELATLQHLAALTIFGGRVREDDIAALASIPLLKSVHLRHGAYDETDVGDVRAARDVVLADRFLNFKPNVRDIRSSASSFAQGGTVDVRHHPNGRYIEETRVRFPGTERDMIHVLNQPGIKEISIGSQCDPRSLAALDHRSGDDGLEVLHIDGAALRGDQWAPVWRQTSLLRLSIARTEIGDDEFAGVAALKKLQSLDATVTNIGDRGLSHLAQLTDLRELKLIRDTYHIQGPWITDDGLVHLKGLTALRYLDISGADVVGPGLEHLAGLPNLNLLRIGGGRLTPDALKHVSRILSLKRLILNAHLNADWTDAMEQLKRERPDLKVNA